MGETADDVGCGEMLGKRVLLSSIERTRTRTTPFPSVSLLTSFRSNTLYPIMAPHLTGSCACSYITYTVANPPLAMSNCHCTTCRKQSGAPYQSWAICNGSDVTWTSIPPTMRQSSERASRGFCPQCGSSICMMIPGERIAVTAGTIDEKPGMEIPRPTEHIFLAEKASWFDLPEDQLKRADQFPSRGE